MNLQLRNTNESGQQTLIKPSKSNFCAYIFYRNNFWSISIFFWFIFHPEMTLSLNIWTSPTIFTVFNNKAVVIKHLSLFPKNVMSFIDAPPGPPQEFEIHQSNFEL